MVRFVLAMMHDNSTILDNHWTAGINILYTSFGFRITARQRQQTYPKIQPETAIIALLQYDV